jgi:hypothetical protein
MKLRLPTPHQIRFRRNKKYWKSVAIGFGMVIFWLPEVIWNAIMEGLQMIVLGLWDILWSVLSEVCSMLLVLGAALGGNVDLAPYDEREEDDIEESGDVEG